MKKHFLKKKRKNSTIVINKSINGQIHGRVWLSKIAHVWPQLHLSILDKYVRVDPDIVTGLVSSCV